ncbi:MAG: hypothetical protein AB7H77_01570 [Bdellovibrionales bacterium]
MKLIPAALAVLLVGVPALAAAPDTSGLFDAPERTVQEALGEDAEFPRDPENPDAKRVIDCYYYSNFVVKQIDIGEKGVSRLSAAPVTTVPSKEKGQPPVRQLPPCSTAPMPGEFTVSADSWSGYFKGVKGNYMFVDADDIYNGGTGLAVFDIAKRAKIYEDLVKDKIKSVEKSGDAVIMRYRRAFAATCSVPSQGKSCWQDIVTKTGLTATTPMPDCDGAYQKAKAELAQLLCDNGESKDTVNCVAESIKALDEQKWTEAPSVIGYNAEVIIGGSAPVAKPTGGAVECWPAD